VTDKLIVGNMPVNLTTMKFETRYVHEPVNFGPSDTVEFNNGLEVVNLFTLNGGRVASHDPVLVWQNTLWSNPPAGKISFHFVKMNTSKKIF
jgi:hypothetical protein